MPSSHLILCQPLLLLPPIPPSIRVFSNESTLCMRWPKYWSFSFSTCLQRNPRAGLLQNGLVGSPCSPRDSQESSPTSQFKSTNSLVLSFLHSYCMLNRRGKLEEMTDFLFLGSKITADSDCSHEIRRQFLLSRKGMTNLDSVLKSRDITLPTKIHIA